jgi:hypothetical protein
MAGRMSQLERVKLFFDPCPSIRISRSRESARMRCAVTTISLTSAVVLSPEFAAVLACSVDADVCCARANSTPVLPYTESAPMQSTVYFLFVIITSACICTLRV